MPIYSTKLRKSLNALIHDMALHSGDFSCRPGKDFTRHSKLGLERTISILLCMEGKSLNNELLNYYQCDSNLPTASAFVQCRSKLAPCALPTLFQRFATAQKPQLYRKHRLLAVDGTTLQIPHNPDDADSLVEYSERQRPVNLLHVNALYDLCTRVYSDAVIEGKQVYNEQRALVQMVRQSVINQAILLADRGYESFNVLAHLQHKGWNFLVRIRDRNGIGAGLPLPNKPEFDVSFSLQICGRKAKHWERQIQGGIAAKFVPPDRFDYEQLCPNSEQTFCLSFRVVRLQVSENVFETVVTNLDRDAFPPEELKTLYARRWGIETSFRKLKYTLGLLHFHAKKAEHIRQEIFARMIMYNFYELIVTHTIIRKSHRKYAYQANFSAAVQICRQFFRGNVSPPVLEALISRFISPIRPGRSIPRTPPARGLVSFAYRVA